MYYMYTRCMTICICDACFFCSQEGMLATFMFLHAAMVVACPMRNAR